MRSLPARLLNTVFLVKVCSGAKRRSATGPKLRRLHQATVGQKQKLAQAPHFRTIILRINPPSDCRPSLSSLAQQLQGNRRMTLNEELPHAAKTDLEHLYRIQGRRWDIGHLDPDVQ